MIIYTNTGWS